MSLTAGLPNRRFELQQRSQLFIRTNNETRSVAAMRSSQDLPPYIATKVTTVISDAGFVLQTAA